jgi:hypothetical protein
MLEGYSFSVRCTHTVSADKGETMCEQTNRDGTQCSNPSRFIVNGLLREAQSTSCGVHLASTVKRLAVFNDDRYKVRNDRHAGTVYVKKEL